MGVLGGPLGVPLGSLGRGQEALKTQKVLSECRRGFIRGALGVILVVLGASWVRPRVANVLFVGFNMCASM